MRIRGMGGKGEGVSVRRDDDDLNRSPWWFPSEVDGDRIGFTALAERQYREASFLDARTTEGLAHAWRDLAEVIATTHSFSASHHFIFHLGHVGSTLVSRLLGEHPALFSVREPALLRLFVPDQAPAPIAPPLSGALLKLWSRTWRSEQTALIKASSIVSEVAEGLLASSTRSRALLLIANPLAYLRAILGGPASRIEQQVLGSHRLARLQRRLGAVRWRLETLSEGEVVAMGWLCETLGLVAAAHRNPGRVLWVNFDQFLDTPRLGLIQMLRFFSLEPDPGFVDHVLGGAIMRRYAKAPEHPYDAELRRSVLMQAERDHAVEIRRGMTWLGAAACEFPAVRIGLETAAAVRLSASTAGPLRDL